MFNDPLHLIVTSNRSGVVILGLLVFVSLLLVVNLLRARVFLKENYKKYQSETTSITKITTPVQWKNINFVR
jgi:hypothetical protein